jgi:hypothetical protein
MTTMTAAAIAWWAIVGAYAPAALTGGSAGGHPSAFVPTLLLAAVLMVIATAVAAIGAARTEGARAEL